MFDGKEKKSPQLSGVLKKLNVHVEITVIASRSTAATFKAF